MVQVAANHLHILSSQTGEKAHVTVNRSLHVASVNMPFIYHLYRCDSCFANLMDLSAQLGYLIMLTDDTNPSNIKQFFIPQEPSSYPIRPY